LDKLFLGSSWGRLYQIESLGHEKRFGTWVELGLKVNPCNPIGILL
jgi:hypothetical protein